eukprot:s5775_g2.t1
METVAGMYSLMKGTRVVLLFWTTAPQDQSLTSGDHLPAGPPACSPREAAGPNSKLRAEEPLLSIRPGQPKRVENRRCIAELTPSQAMAINASRAERRRDKELNPLSLMAKMTPGPGSYAGQEPWHPWLLRAA